MDAALKLYLEQNIPERSDQTTRPLTWLHRLNKLALANKMPPRFYFNANIIATQQHRCPECKIFFKDEEEIVRRDGYWYFHSECSLKRTARQTNGEHEEKSPPKHSNLRSDGRRVIRKPGGL